jgi:hypothetical protein
LKRTGIDGEKQVTGLDIGAIGKVNLNDAAGNLGLDGDDFSSDNLADRIDVERDILRRRCGRGNRRRRPLKRRLRLFAATREQANRDQCPEHCGVRPMLRTFAICHEDLEL